MNIFRIKLFFSVVFVILLTFFTSGCDTPCRIAPLVNAERIIEERPDSALVILTKLNDSILNTPGDKALYALLLTQANVKTYTANASDSLINIAVDYYSGRRDKERYMKSLFYQAQVRYDIGQYDMAIVPASTARDLAIEFGDPYWRAKAAELMADIFAKYYMRQETIDYTKESVEQYGLAGKERNKRFALTDLAIAYYNSAKTIGYSDSIGRNIDLNKSMAILDSLYLITARTDSLLLSYIIEHKLDINVRIGEMETASSLMDSLMQIDSEFYHSIPTILYDKAYIQMYNGNITEAEQLFDLLNDNVDSPSEKAMSLEGYISLYRYMHDYKKMSQIFEKVIDLQNKTINSVLERSVITKLKNNTEYKAAEEKLYFNRVATTLVAIVFLVIISAVFVILFMRTRFKLNKIKADRFMEEIVFLKDDAHKLQDAIDSVEQKKSDLLDLIADRDRQISRINDEIHQLNEEKDKEWQNKTAELQGMLDEAIKDKEKLIYRANELKLLLVSQIKDNESKNKAMEDLFVQRWEIIKNLCDDYISKGGVNEFDKTIPKTLKDEIEKLKKPKYRKQLVNFVDCYIGNIITLMREEGDFIHSNDDEFLYALFFLGFSAKSISLLTKTNFKTVFTKKSRLKEKIISTNPPHKDLFLSKLE